MSLCSLASTINVTFDLFLEKKFRLKVIYLQQKHQQLLTPY